MSKYIPVTNFSDRTPKVRLIETDDISILRAAAEAANFPNRENAKIEEIKLEITKEKSKKYPCSDFIARCETKILEIRQSIAFYNLQRQKI